MTNGATTSVDFTVSVSDSLTLNARGDQNYTLDTAITALELPVATGGTDAADLHSDQCAGSKL